MSSFENVLLIPWPDCVSTSTTITCNKMVGNPVTCSCVIVVQTLVGQFTNPGYVAFLFGNSKVPSCILVYCKSNIVGQAAKTEGGWNMWTIWTALHCCFFPLKQMWTWPFIFPPQGVNFSPYAAGEGESWHLHSKGCESRSLHQTSTAKQVRQTAQPQNHHLVVAFLFDVYLSMQKDQITSPTICFARWALWFFKNDKSKTWQANLRLISKFDTVEDFWA